MNLNDDSKGVILRCNGGQSLKIDGLRSYELRLDYNLSQYLNKVNFIDIYFTQSKYKWALGLNPSLSKAKVHVSARAEYVYFIV